MLPSFVLAAAIIVPHPANRAPLSEPAASKQTIEHLTFHFDNDRTGWNPYEKALTPASVHSKNFALLSQLAVDGNVIAQPLVAANVQVSGATRNVLIVATEYNSVYAYDADSLQPLWHTSFNDKSAGIGPETASESSCSQIAPWIGVSSTPVIDPTTHRIYVLAKTVKGSGGSAVYANTLHALSIVDGTDAVPPVVVNPPSGFEAFDQHWQVDRIGLLEARGKIYVGFGSSCDINANTVHGWLFGYDKATLALRNTLNTTPDTSGYALGSLWQSTFAPAADEHGNIFVATGNGDFDANTGGNDYGDSLIRLTPALKVASSFTPYDQQQLFNDDGDLGSGGIMLLPAQTGISKTLAVAAGKQDAIYLVDRSNLGGYVQNGPNHDVFEVPFGNNGIWGGPGYYSNGTTGYVYYALGGSPLVAYALTASPRIKLVAASQTPNAVGGVGGAIPAISSNGGKHGVVWVISRPGGTSSPLILYAYDASNLGTMLFQSSLENWQNGGGSPFLTPTVVNGKVYVGTSDSVFVFGLSSDGMQRR